MHHEKTVAHFDDDGNNDSLKTNVTENISEYKPTDEETRSSSEINNTEITANSNNNTNEISSAPENNEYSQFKFNVPGNSACNNFELTAEMSNGLKGNNNKNFCVFCHTLQSKIARHLENKHRDEDQVKDFLNLPKGCAEHLYKIASIRKEGNFIFNATKEFNHGRLITVRRPTQKTKHNGTNFVNCPYCNGFYAQNNLRHHVQQCNKDENSSSRTTLQNAQRALGRYHPEISRRMRVEILPILQEDEITKAIRYDHAIILYGNNMCKSHVHEHQNNYIRAHRCLLGRLVLALRNRNSEINTLAAAYAPQFYKMIIEAVNDVAEFDYNTNMYKHPTNASTLGTYNQITRVANFMDHHEHIHKEIYKQPVAKVDILEMSKILEKAQGVNMTTTSNETDTFVSQTFVDTNEAFTDTSIEAKEKKEVWKKKKQKVKRKKITQNREKQNNTIKKMQNVQKKNKDKDKFCKGKDSDSDISDYAMNTSSSSSNESIVHENKKRKQKNQSLNISMSNNEKNKKKLSQSIDIPYIDCPAKEQINSEETMKSSYEISNKITTSSSIEIIDLCYSPQNHVCKGPSENVHLRPIDEL
ncbi:myb-like protein A [Polyergus mexicanus]|uniref:myb-like protein A n=1 Tax=Polyergus mexicanus TaxID=615972 RepID=UPI0038B45A46